MELDGLWLFAIRLCCPLSPPLLPGPPYPLRYISSSSSLVFPQLFCRGPPSSSLSLWLRQTISICSSQCLPGHNYLLITSSIGTLPCHFAPAMYLNILLSVVPIISCNQTVKCHVSEPYKRTDLMHASYTLARRLKGTSRSNRRLDISFHFSQDGEILALTATSTPPSHSSSTPRYSNSMLLSSFSWTPSPLYLEQSLSLRSVFAVQSISCGTRYYICYTV